LTARFSELFEQCKQARIFTHLPFIATILLAKAVDASLDVMVIKPSHASEGGNLFSARGLCKTVLVPFAVRNNIDLGTRGNDPLNNQPYGRMVKFGDGVPIAKRGVELFHLVETIVLEIDAIHDEMEAKSALSSLLSALRNEPQGTAQPFIRLTDLKCAVNDLSRNFSEYGRVAQAIVAGVVEAAFGDVKTKLVNDPSRRFPGDVQFAIPRARGALGQCFVEVRDKIVSETDARIFFDRCRSVGGERAIIFVSTKNDNKQILHTMEAEDFFGCTIIGTDALIDQIALWSCNDLQLAAGSIHRHLMQIGTSEKCLVHWLQRTIKE
jgi:hypothetical protein